jgi:hypothetical protein
MRGNGEEVLFKQLASGRGREMKETHQTSCRIIINDETALLSGLSNAFWSSVRSYVPMLGASRGVAAGQDI